MIDLENYSKKDHIKKLIQNIKDIELDMIKNKIGATNSEGDATYEYMKLRDETNKLLEITKPKEDGT
jgi:hypothetical protein